MAEPPAVDASPLIFLARAGYIDLLKLIADEVVVPQVVAGEILRRGAEDPTVQTLTTTPWLRIAESGPVPASIERWDLGSGESSVLTWCLAHRGARAVIDDLAGRRCARAHGIELHGTLGLVLLGKQRGALTAARPVLEKMRRSGMYLSDHVLDRALHTVGE